MKRVLMIAFVMIVIVSLSASSTLAGSAQRYRWEGVAIGIVRLTSIELNLLRNGDGLIRPGMSHRS